MEYRGISREIFNLPVFYLNSLPLGNLVIIVSAPTSIQSIYYLSTLRGRSCEKTMRVGCQFTNGDNFLSIFIKNLFFAPFMDCKYSITSLFFYIGIKADYLDEGSKCR
jgi:hypothetical protein